MTKLDFAQIKARVPVEAAIDLLGLEMPHEVTNDEGAKVWRGRCPACQSTNTRKLVVTEGKGAYCWDLKKGGDVIWLVAHVRGIAVREAAQQLHSHAFLGARPVGEALGRVVGQVEAAQTGDDLAAKLDKVRTTLIYAHPILEKLGLTPEVAQAIGWGFATRGTKANRVLIPLFKDGKHIDYAGYNPEKDPAFLFSPKLSERL